MRCALCLPFFGSYRSRARMAFATLPHSGEQYVLGRAATDSSPHTGHRKWCSGFTGTSFGLRSTRAAVLPKSITICTGAASGRAPRETLQRRCASFTLAGSCVPPTDNGTTRSMLRLQRIRMTERPINLRSADVASPSIAPPDRLDAHGIRVSSALDRAPPLFRLALTLVTPTALRLFAHTEKICLALLAT